MSAILTGSNPVDDCSEDRLHRPDPARLGSAARADTGQRDGVSNAETARINELEREVRELKRANEILRLVSAYFAQAELDRRNK